MDGRQDMRRRLGGWPAGSRALRRFLAREGGSVAVESAIILGAFMLIVFGTVDLMLAFFVSASLENAADAAGNALSLTRDPVSAQIAAQNTLVGFAQKCLDPVDIITWNELSGADFLAGQGGAPTVDGIIAPQAVVARIELRCTWGFLTPVMAQAVGADVALSAWTVVPLETVSPGPVP